MSHSVYHRASLLAAIVLLACTAWCQAGGAGAAGAGAAAGASGPGAGAAAHGAPGAQAATAAQGNMPGQVQSPAAAYAAGARPGSDPRKPPQAAPGAYTLPQVLDLARLRNPTFLAARQNLESVRAQEIQAGLRANPYLTLYGQNVTEGNDASTPFAFSAQVSRLFERGEKRRFRLDAARATTAQTGAQLEDTIRQTELTLRTAFTHILVAKEALELSSASLKDFRHEVEIANDRYQAGDLSKLDFERLDLQLGSFESDEATSRVALLQASYQMQTLIGLPAPGPAFDITGAVVPPLLPQSQDALEQLALANRPDYAAARFGVEVAEANARLAQAQGTTDPTLEAEYDRNGPENSVGFSFNIPLRIFDRNQGNKSTTRSLAQASQFTAAAARNQVVSDVIQAYAGYAESRHLSDRFSEHYLDESIDVLSIAQYAFEHGGLALIDYLDALRGARTATSDALNAYQQTWLALHQLSAATNRDLTP